MARIGKLANLYGNEKLTPIGTGLECIGMDWHGLAWIGKDWQGLANWREWPRKWHGIGIGLAGIGIGFARIGTDWIVDKVMIGKGGKMVSNWRIDRDR